jgi:predicted amidohydrolase
LFRVGYYQFKPVFGGIEKNRDKILSALENISADLLVLPELPFTGYFFRHKEELLSLSEDPKNSQTIEMMSEFCRKNRLFIVTGFAEKKKIKYITQHF